MEHSVHLGAEKFVKGVLPTASNAILQKVHHPFEDARKGNNLDQLNATLKDFDEDPDPDNNSDETEFQCRRCMWQGLGSRQAGINLVCSKSHIIE
jgi:hypothetical protein